MLYTNASDLWTCFLGHIIPYKRLLNPLQLCTWKERYDYFEGPFLRFGVLGCDYRNFQNLTPKHKT